MKHLTEDILIQYQFGLLADSPRRDAAEHLASCDKCRIMLSSIQQRFAVLDVLKADETMPQTLVTQTLAQCSRQRTPSLFFWKLGGLVSAAAAVLIVGLVWLNQPRTSEKKVSAPTIAQLDTDKRQPATSRPAAPPMAKAELPAQPQVFADAQDTAALAGAVASGARVVDADAIPDTPPFAPASAIELVVLPNPDAMQVTIYNSADLTLVRDTRKLVLKPGWNWLQFMWANTKIDPTSLSLRPLDHADNIDIQQLVFPARLREIGRWLIRSEVEGAVPFEITYFTSGLSWRAVYEGTMSGDERAMDLRGYVRVENNSGQDYANAQTRLLLGQVRLLDQIAALAGRKYPYGPDVLEERLTWYFADKKGIESLTRDSRLSAGFAGGAFDDFAADFDVSKLKKDIERQGLSEYFLYTIEGTENLPDTWGKRLESLDVSVIPIENLYKYDEERYGQQTMRFVSFTNDEEHELGETPLPEGSIHLFRTLNDAQNLSYIGQSQFKYIPVNEDVELNMGASEVVKVEPKLMDVQTANHIFDKDNNVDGWDEIETWQIKLANTRDIPAEIEITRGFDTYYWELKLQDSVGTAHPTYTKHDKNHARFTLTLPPRSEKFLSYAVTKYQGQRSEYYAQKERERTK